MKKPLAILLLLVVVVAGLSVVIYWRSRPTLGAAREALRKGDWADARRTLDGWLETHPEDHAARMMLVTAMLSDQTFQNLEGTIQVAEVLDEIPDSAPEGLEARMRQAELELIRRSRCAAAEDLLQRILVLDPSATPAHAMMWRCYQISGRVHLAEPHFRATFDAASDGERLGLLREWYVSQFLPQLVMADYDKLIGLVNDPEAVPKRLGILIQQEPESPVLRAALARAFFESGGDVAEAVDVLTDERVDKEQVDGYYTGTLVEGLLKLGKLDEARKAFDAWPGPKEGFEYHRAAAMLQEDADQNFDAAVGEYQKALAIWPGAVDLRLQSRYAACLAKARKEDEAAAAREAIEKTKSLMEADVHVELQGLLARLGDPEARAQFADFYRKLGREQEARLWDEVTLPIDTP